MSYRREPRIQENTWILVADRAKAIIFQADWPELQQFSEVMRLENPNGSMNREEILTDRQGRFTSYGVTSQSGEPQTDLRHQTAQEFALEIVEKLEQGRTSHQFGRLIMVSPALMLGVLRDTVSAPLSKTVVLTVRKELIDAPVREIQEQVTDALAEKQEAELVSDRG